jgi:plexin A
MELLEFFVLFQAFAELQTDISDIANDLQVSGIPYVDSRIYIVRIFFPLSNNHPILQESRPCRNNRCNGFETTMSRFKALLDNKVFLLTFVNALESQPTFGIRDRSNVASLLMTVLLDKLDYFTE